MNEILRILLIDDNPDDRLLTIRALRREFPDLQVEQIIEAKGLAQALEAGDFDLVITDYQLRWSDGLAVLRAVKARWPDCPVIMFTATGSEEIAVEAMKNGLDDYVLKSPKHFIRLPAAVRLALKRAEDSIERKRAEEALRESEGQYRSVVEHSHAGILIVDAAYRFIYVNDELGRILGYSREEIVGQDFRGFLDDESKQLVADRYVRRQRGEKVPPRYEFNIVRKDGEKRRVEISSTVIKDSAGKVKTVAQILDITERKRAEEELIRLSSAVRMSTDSIVISDIEAKIIDVNQATLDMYGTDDKGDLIGKGAFDLLAPEDREKAFAGMQEVLEKGYAKGLEYRVITKNGSRIPVEMSVAIMQDADGELIGFVGISRDITERKRAEEEVRRHLERVEALRKIDRAITSTLDLTEVLDIILEELERVIPYHSASIFLLSDGTAKLTAGRGFPDLERALQISFPVKEDALTRELLQEKRPLVLADAQADERFRARGDTGYVRSWLGVPLIVKERALGFLTIDHREPGVYDEDSADMAQAFAGQVAIVIENARLYEEAQRELAERKRAEEELRHTLERLREALGGIIQTVALTVETRDPYTAGHQRRVANLARAIAAEMGLSTERIEGIRMAAVIHDMGKITVPTDILNKPGRLTEHEFGIIKCHPKTGYDILKTIEFPWPIAQMIFQHHERLDGSGYPQGLAGKDILMKARILAVADVVEAMASFRPYRPALGIDKALEEISQNRGVLYDPEVVDACLKLFTAKGFEFE